MTAQPKPHNYLGSLIYDFIWGYAVVVKQRGQQVRARYTEGRKKGKLSPWETIDPVTWKLLNS